MSSEQPDPLESLIVEILEAENRGEIIDRDTLLKQHSAHAQSLRDFFAQHDQMKAMADAADLTLSPDSGNPSESTIPSVRGSQQDTSIPSQSPRNGPTVAALESTSSAATVAEKVQYFGDYEMLEEIARGGMGVVFKARQISLNRIVALKMVLAGQFAGEEDVQRFYTEAEAAAQLDHPGIVPIFEIGEHKGQHYFSMGFVEGESLALKVADGPLPPREAAELVMKICDAMAYAHQRGVIHRDLKPANILIDRNGQPKVTDFGLAKKTEADSNLTGTGQILGTPAYMPPEQASANPEIGPLADVYSMGAILYCLLTGRPPFQGSSPMDTLVQVLGREPVSPRHLNPHVPQDLNTICLKCLGKESSKRYQSSAELADELQRYLQGRTILARPVGQIERARRWCKRKPALATLVFTVSLLLLAIPAAAIMVALRENGIREVAENALFRMYTDRGFTAAEEGQNAFAALWFAAAIESSEPGSRRNHISRVSYDDYARLPVKPVRVFWHGDDLVCNLSFSSTGKYLATLTSTGRCRIWDVNTNEVVLTRDNIDCIAWSPRPKWIALGDRGGQAELVSVVDWDTDCTINLGEPITAIGFSPNQEFLALAGKTLRLWDLEKSEFGPSTISHGGTVVRTIFSSTGRELVTTCSDNFARVIKINKDLSAKLAYPKVAHTGKASWLQLPMEPVFFGDDRFLAVCAGNNIRWIDVVTGETHRQMTAAGQELIGCAISPDGDIFATAGRFSLQTWDTETGEEIANFSRSDDLFLDVVFANDRESMMACHEDGQLLVIDTDTGARTSVRHVGEVTDVQISPDGKFFATTQIDGLVRLWKAGERAFGPNRIDLPGRCTNLKNSNDGKQILASGSSWWFGNLSSVRVYSSQTLEPSGPPLGNSTIITDAVFSPDDEMIVTADINRELRFWNWRTGKQARAPISMPLEARSLEFDPSGRTLAIACTSGLIQLRDALDYSLLREFQHGKTRGLVRTRRLINWYVDPEQKGNHGREVGPKVRYLTFGQSGKTLITHGFDETAIAWDLADFRKCFSPLISGDHVINAQFSPDGAVIATSSNDGGARIWDFRTGKLIATLEHPGWVLAISFSPDGNRLLTSCKDGQARVWDWRKAKLAYAPLKQRGQMLDAKYTPDGQWIITCTRRGDLRVWDAELGLRAGRGVDIDGECFCIHVTTDSQRVLVTGRFPAIYTTSLSHLRDIGRGDSDVAKLSAELMSGSRIEYGGTVNLTTSEWLDRWYQLVEQKNLPVLSGTSFGLLGSEPRWQSGSAESGRGTATDS